MKAARSIEHQQSQRIKSRKLTLLHWLSGLCMSQVEPYFARFKFHNEVQGTDSFTSFFTRLHVSLKDWLWYKGLSKCYPSNHTCTYPILSTPPQHPLSIMFHRFLPHHCATKATIHAPFPATSYPLHLASLLSCFLPPKTLVYCITASHLFSSSFFLCLLPYPTQPLPAHLPTTPTQPSPF